MLKGFFQRLGSVFAGRKLDESLLEELEEQLIMGDVSLETSQSLLDALREAARKGETPTDEAALKCCAAKSRVCSLLTPIAP